MPQTDMIEQHRESLGPQIGQRSMLNERGESEEEETKQKADLLLFISIVEIRGKETSSGTLANTQVTVQPRSRKEKTKVSKGKLWTAARKQNEGEITTYSTIMSIE